MNPGTQDWTPTILGGNNRRPSKASMNQAARDGKIETEKKCERCACHDCSLPVESEAFPLRWLNVCDFFCGYLS